MSFSGAIAVYSTESCFYDLTEIGKTFPVKMYLPQWTFGQCHVPPTLAIVHVISMLEAEHEKLVQKCRLEEG